MKSPEWRWQRRRADLRHFEIFRHGPTIIYTRLPAGGTYYPICTFPASSECLIGISDAFSAFCLQVSVIFPTCSLYPQQKRAYSALHPQALTECSPLDFRRSSITKQSCNENIALDYLDAVYQSYNQNTTLDYWDSSYQAIM